MKSCSIVKTKHADLRTYQIGELSRLSGVSAATIRHYERAHLLSEPLRSENGYRLYQVQDIHRLRFVRLCRSLDMSLDEIRSLLHLNEQEAQDSQQAHATFDEHLMHVRQRILELQNLEQEILYFQEQCSMNHTEELQEENISDQNRCRLIEALHLKADDLRLSNQQKSTKSANHIQTPRCLSW